jgi:hypothetical protein
LEHQLQSQLVLVAILLAPVLVLILVQFLRMAAVMVVVLKAAAVVVVVVAVQVIVKEHQVEAFTQDQFTAMLLDKATTAAAPALVLIRQAPQAVAVVVVALAALDHLMVLVDQVVVAHLLLLDCSQ